MAARGLMALRGSRDNPETRGRKVKMAIRVHLDRRERPGLQGRPARTASLAHKVRPAPPVTASASLDPKDRPACRGHRGKTEDKARPARRDRRDRKARLARKDSPVRTAKTARPALRAHRASPARRA